MLTNTWQRCGGGNNCLEARTWTKATASNGNGGNNCLEVRRWTKSSKSGGNTDACVEAMYDTQYVQVRDTKAHGTGPTLTFAPTMWTAFIGDVRTGTFALPQQGNPA